MSADDSSRFRSLIDDTAVDLVMQLIAIPGKSGDESAIAQFIVDQLHDCGISDNQICFDQAHAQSHLGGQIGNLIVDLPGTLEAPRQLLMAHIDTVPLCVGAQPVRDDNLIRSTNPETALGGDNRAGAAVVLNTVRLIQKHSLPHPPLTILFTVQEEVGLIGARYVDQQLLKSPELCFNWDGGRPDIAVIGATGDDHITIEVQGIASHAGAHPEKGVSAAVIASKAIYSLYSDGWLGQIEKGKQSGTSNIGIMQGGAATNVVMDSLKIEAEARSHNSEFRSKIVKTIQREFELAARKATNVDGKAGRIKFITRHKYEAFQLPSDAPVVRAAMSAIKACKLTPETRISNGGLDANWMNAHGFPTVTLGCGQSEIHTVNEQLNVSQFLDACRIALMLGTGSV